MKILARLHPLHLCGSMIVSCAALSIFSCTPKTAFELRDDDNADAFAQVKPLLERNCVNCHAEIRLPGMPSLVDTKSLASLIGPGKLIVPGHPEKSRFYIVVTLADNQAGAMPPSGHAMTKKEVALLREWIRLGAELPAENNKLEGRGRSPRSR